MLDKEDIKLLEEMLARQKTEIKEELTGSISAKMDVMKEEITNEVTQRVTENVTQRVTEEVTRRMKILLDTEVTPKFTLLAEGQQAIIDRLDRLEPEKRFAEMDDDSIVLRAAVKQLARDVQALKRQAN